MTCELDIMKSFLANVIDRINIHLLISKYLIGKKCGDQKGIIGRSGQRSGQLGLVDIEESIYVNIMKGMEKNK